MERLKSYFESGLEKISTLPTNVPKEQYHYYVLTNYIFVLALVAHFFLLLTFAILKITPLALFNIASCLIFLFAILASCRGYILLSTGLGSFEVVTHAILCVYVLGWNSGFQYYILGLVIAFLEAPWKSVKVKVTLLIIVVIVYILLNYYSQEVTPVTTLEPLLLNVFNIVNLLMFIFVIAFSMLASDSAVARAEAKLAEALEKVKVSKQETEKKNSELDEALEKVKVSQQETEKKNLELEKKNEELANKNKELSQSYKRANQIFSALSEALPGTVLDGKYQLDAKIGSGGFGAVYKATHLTTKRAVAAKIFQPMAANASVEGLERFQLEAILACKINHPNAVEILDSGISTNGIAYIIMELLKGANLAYELRRHSKLSVQRCAEILVPICDVLTKAHDRGIVHRDIKPDNIFLHEEEGLEIVKVVDFGIAKLQESSESLNQQSITATGDLLGTPAYMSPERLLNKGFDGKADVYSLGVMLYQMLSGELPFGSKDVWSMIGMQINSAPKSLREKNNTVSLEVETVVFKALMKDPNKRPTAKELAQEFSTVSGFEIRPFVSGSIKPLIVSDGKQLVTDEIGNTPTMAVTVRVNKDTKAGG